MTQHRLDPVALTETPQYSRSVLVRMAAVPVTQRLALAHTELFDAAADLDQHLSRLACEQTVLRDRLITLINQHPLPRADTKALGALAKRVGRGAVLREQERSLIDSLLLAQHSALAQHLYALDNRRQQLDTQQHELTQALVQAPAKSAQQLWLQCQAQPALRCLLQYRDADFFARCERLGHSLAFWQNKKGRLNAQYLLRIINRASFRSTPRDWHSYVGLVPISDQPQSQVIQPTGQYAHSWSDNIHHLRQQQTLNLPANRDQLSLSLAPVHWMDAQQIFFCITQWEQADQVKAVHLNRSDFLNQLIDALHCQSLSYATLHARLRDRLDDDEYAVVDDFLRYLIDLGVVQLSSPPHSTHSPWQPLPTVKPAVSVQPATPEVTKRSGTKGYLDVYSQLKGNLAYDSAQAL